MLSFFKEKFEQDGIYLKADHYKEWPMEVGYKKEFKWRLMATQANTFIMVLHCDEPLSLPVYHKYVGGCMKYANKNHTGWPKGLQSGVISIPVIICPSASAEVKANVLSPPGTHFGAFELPVVLETETRQMYYYEKTQFWGWAFYPYIHKQIRTYVVDTWSRAISATSPSSEEPI